MSALIAFERRHRHRQAFAAPSSKSRHLVEAIINTGAGIRAREGSSVMSGSDRSQWREVTRESQLVSVNEQLTDFRQC